MRLAAFDLACVRGGREVFKKLHFAVHGGEMLAVTGPNGAGKSSLLRLIAGLVRPAGGGLTLDGGDSELRIGEQAHYVGHQDALKPSLTVRENLAFWNGVLGGANEVAAPLACPPSCDKAPDLAARRAELGARCRGAGDARRNHAHASCRRRDRPRGHSWTPRARSGARTETRIETRI